MAECSSKQFERLVNFFYESFSMEKCSKNPEHSVFLVVEHPKTFFCETCNVCYGLDDSSPLDLLNIVNDSNYMCVEKCTKCGNNNPEFLTLVINDNERKLICKKCSEIIALDDSKMATDISGDCDFSKNKDIQNASKSALEISEDDKKNHESHFVDIYCSKCDGGQGFMINDDNGKLGEIICTQCNLSNYFNETYHEKIVLKNKVKKHSEENCWKKDYLKKEMNELKSIDKPISNVKSSGSSNLPTSFLSSNLINNDSENNVQGNNTENFAGDSNLNENQLLPENHSLIHIIGNWIYGRSTSGNKNITRIMRAVPYINLCVKELLCIFFPTVEQYIKKFEGPLADFVKKLTQIIMAADQINQAINRAI